MSFLILFALSWAAFYLLIDFSRLHELYPNALLSCFLGIWTDLIMVRYNLWQYKAPPLSSLTIPLLLDWSVYPVSAMLYIQFVPRKFRFWQHLGYTFLWVIGAILLEWFFVKRGEMMYDKWWSLPLSFLTDWLIFYSLYGTYRMFLPYIKQNTTDQSRG